MIPQIYITAVITVMISVGFWGWMIYLFTGRQKHYFWLLVLGLPLSAIANLILKRHAIIWMGQTFHVPPGLGLASPAWFLTVGILVTPLVEEPIKVLPLLLRPAWKMVTSRANALWVGFVLGVSFGLGEAVFLAYAIAQNPAYNSLPWYAYTGYFGERLITCFVHGVFTAIVVIGMQRGGRYIIYGFVTAVGLHLFLNAPVVMFQFKWISLELYNVSLLIPLILLAVIFERMRRTARDLRQDQSENEVVYWRRQISDRHG